MSSWTMYSGIQRHQVPVIGIDQVPLNICVQGCFLERIFRRLAVNKTGAFAAQEVPDQYTAGAMDKGINRQALFTFDFKCASRARHTARA